MEKQMQVYCEDRLKKVLVKDKSENPTYILNVLKSDLLVLLNNYMEILPENLDINICVTENGIYKIFLEGFSKRIKVIRHV